MSTFEPLQTIDIPESRKVILKSIAECRRMQKLASIAERFFAEVNPAKPVTKRLADKLHERFLAEEDLLVSRVTLKIESRFFGEKDYRFTVGLYGRPDTWFLMRLKDGAIDMDELLFMHRRWGPDAAVLEERLGKFAYHATKFNEALAALREQAKFGADPNGHGGLHPLSDFFHWYQLCGSSAK